MCGTKPEINQQMKNTDINKTQDVEKVNPSTSLTTASLVDTAPSSKGNSVSLDILLTKNPPPQKPNVGGVHSQPLPFRNVSYWNMDPKDIPLTGIKEQRAKYASAGLPVTGKLTREDFLERFKREDEARQYMATHKPLQNDGRIY